MGFYASLEVDNSKVEFKQTLEDREKIWAPILPDFPSDAVDGLPMQLAEEAATNEL